MGGDTMSASASRKQIATLMAFDPQFTQQIADLCRGNKRVFDECVHSSVVRLYPPGAEARLAQNGRHLHCRMRRLSAKTVTLDVLPDDPRRRPTGETLTIGYYEFVQCVVAAKAAA